VRRMKAGPTAETRPVQRVIMSCITAAFVLFLVVCGLDHRFGWSNVPLPAVIFGDFLIALSFYVFTKVCLENHFASATIELHEGQNVVSTGMYGVVRHPIARHLLECSGSRYLLERSSCRSNAIVVVGSYRRQFRQWVNVPIARSIRIPFRTLLTPFIIKIIDLLV
jgi:hypothetical protein